MKNSFANKEDFANDLDNQLKKHINRHLVCSYKLGRSNRRAVAKAKGDKKVNPNCYSHSWIGLTTKPIVASITVQFTPNCLNKTIFAFPLEHDIQRKKRGKTARGGGGCKKGRLAKKNGTNQFDFLCLA